MFIIVSSRGILSAVVADLTKIGHIFIILPIRSQTSAIPIGVSFYNVVLGDFLTWPLGSYLLFVLGLTITPPSKHLAVL